MIRDPVSPASSDLGALDEWRRVGFWRLTITAGSGSAYDSAAQDAYFDSLYSSAFAALTYSSTKYVSTSGSNANNGNSLGTAYASVDYAVSQIGANGLILVADGTYNVGTSGWLNSTTANAPPNGTGANYTVIRAINPGAVTISQTSQSYYGSLLRPTNSQRIWIDGFNFSHDAAHDDEAIFHLPDFSHHAACSGAGSRVPTAPRSTSAEAR